MCDATSDSGIREEEVALADLTVDALFQPGVTAIVCWVVIGGDGAADRDHAVGAETHGHGGDEVLGKCLASREGAHSQNII